MYVFSLNSNCRAEMNQNSVKSQIPTLGKTKRKAEKENISLNAQFELIAPLNQDFSG